MSTDTRQQLPADPPSPAPDAPPAATAAVEAGSALVLPASLATPPADAAPSIALSWRRCAERGLAREAAVPLETTDRTTLLAAPDVAQRLGLARPAMEDVFQFIEGSQCVIGFTDAEAYLLDLVGDRRLLYELVRRGWLAGSCWSEASAGANAIALALTDAFPTQVSGEAHYCQALAPYCTSAAPVYDSLGSLVGALFAVTRAAESHPHTLGMISATASALTGELSMTLWQSSANERLAELHAILQTLSEGVILLQPNGAVTQMTAQAGRLLGLSPARVTGRRLADVVELPPTLADALSVGGELRDEEVSFRVGGERIICLCTLHAIAAPAAYGGSGAFASLLDADGGGAPPLGGAGHRGAGRRELRVSPRGAVGCFVLSLRSIERAQRLAHRMTGAQARMRFNNIVGQSPPLLNAVRLAQIAAESASTVLLRGETGVGKEIFAQSIHNASARANGPFVAINCGAIPRELISSELFGYEGGAFSGADRGGRPGKFELAHGGALFLDEIGDMPYDLQTSLLRAIETHSVVRVGGQHVRQVDVRIIAATHKDLAAETQQGAFRSDLFFRLNVFPIEVPPLRERVEDIPLLTRYILQRLSARLNRTLGVEPDALAALEAYHWPGNVRELENVVERAIYVAEQGTITLADLPDPIRARYAADINFDPDPPVFAQQPLAAPFASSHHPAPAPSFPAPPDTPAQRRALHSESANAEAAIIRRALRASHGAIGEAAQALGVSRTTLWRKMRRYGL